MFSLQLIFGTKFLALQMSFLSYDFALQVLAKGLSLPQRLFFFHFEDENNSKLIPYLVIQVFPPCVPYIFIAGKTNSVEIFASHNLITNKQTIILTILLVIFRITTVIITIIATLILLMKTAAIIITITIVAVVVAAVKSDDPIRFSKCY